MQTLFLLTLMLASWHVASLDEASPAAPAVQAAATATAPAAAMTTPAQPVAPVVSAPVRMVDGVDYSQQKPKARPKVQGVPAPKPPQVRTPPAPQARAPQTPPNYYSYPQPVYVYVYVVPVQSRPTTNYAIEDAYYNPVFKGADQWHYDPWPEYLLYGEFWPAYISFPYPNPPQGRCFYQYLPAYLHTLNQVTMPIYSPRPTCYHPW